MAVTLSPIGNGFQFFSVGGLPLSGGLLYTYTAGTSTPLTSYTDSAGAIANTNPIVLDAGGRPPAEIWLTTGSAYKFVLTDSLSTPIGPALDNITGIANLNNATLTGNTVIGTTGNTLNVANSALVVSSGNTAVGGDLSVAGNTALGNASGDIVTINAATIAAPNNTTVSGDWAFSGKLTSVQPGFCAYKTAAFTVGTSATPVVVLFDNIDFNTGSGYSTGTGIYTVPTTGKYQITFGMAPQFAGGSAEGTVFQAPLYKNGSSISERACLYAIKTLAAGTEIMALQSSIVLQLTAADTLKVMASFSDASSSQCSAINAAFSASLLA